MREAWHALGGYGVNVVIIAIGRGPPNLRMARCTVRIYPMPSPPEHYRPQKLL
jgi:hypothetical protein